MARVPCPGLSRGLHPGAVPTAVFLILGGESLQFPHLKTGFIDGPRCMGCWGDSGHAQRGGLH